MRAANYQLTGRRNNYQVLMSASWNTAAFFFNVIGALSVLLLFDHATDFGWISSLELLLSYYDLLKNFILKPIAPAAKYLAEQIANIFNLNFRLLDHWSDVFVLVSLYLGARARSYWKAGLISLAGFRFAWGFIVALLIGVVAGMSNPNGIQGNLWMLATVISGLALYDAVDAAWAATFHRKAGLSWAHDWVRYAAFSFPSILIGVGFLTVSYYGNFLIDLSWINAPGLVTLLVYAFFLAFYWLWRGFQSSLNSERSGTGYDRFASSSNSQIAFLMLRSLGGALIVLAFNAGWSALSL